jgi:phosphoserine phosphatase
MCSADSPGRSTLKTEAVWIFDLDGTILSVNSFPYWARYMLIGHFDGLNALERLALFLRTSQALTERKLLGQNHYHTKRKLQKLWSHSLKKDVGQAAAQRLSTLLQAYIRPNMQSLMETVASRQADALLATAAAGEYALGLGKALGFTHILATPLCTDSDTLENCAERKRDRVLSLLAAQEWNHRKRILFTDHEEDLPLIDQCHRTLWFGRDEDVRTIQERVPQAEIVACRHLPDAQIRRLVTISTDS